MHCGSVGESTASWLFCPLDKFFPFRSIRASVKTPCVLLSSDSLIGFHDGPARDLTFFFG